MKTCTKCGETKPLDGFNKRSIYKDGLNYWCKSCTRASLKAHRMKMKAEGRTAYSTGNRQCDYSGKHRAKNRHKHRAWRAVMNAIASGRLVKQPCEACGCFPAHAHHDDYSKPLEVRWLCPTHHSEAHLKAKAS